MDLFLGFQGIIHGTRNELGKVEEAKELFCKAKEAPVLERDSPNWTMGTGKSHWMKPLRWG